MIYNAVLVAAELPPPLSLGEREALETTACACAQKYAGDFQHWELAAFAAALITPALMRFMAKYREEAAEEEAKPRPVPMAPPSETRPPPTASFFAGSSSTSEVVAGAT